MTSRILRSPACVCCALCGRIVLTGAARMLDICGPVYLCPRCPDVYTTGASPQVVIPNSLPREILQPGNPPHEARQASGCTVARLQRGRGEEARSLEAPGTRPRRPSGALGTWPHVEPL